MASTKNNPFNVINSINAGKPLPIEQVELESVPFITNKNFSLFTDTLFHANIMNRYHELSPSMQYDYLINSIRPRKRFSKWPKRVDNEDVTAVMKYFDYSRSKAEQAILNLNSQQIKDIKELLEEGGRI